MTTDENLTPNAATLQSFLLADCGSQITSVVLFDVVDGVYRLVAYAQAPTTAGMPWLDLALGVQQAIAEITEITGRVLLTEKGELIRPAQANGTGVDRFGMTTSAAPPLTAVLVGLLDEVSLASARRALQSIYTLELDHFSLADQRSQQAQVEALLAQQPDLLLIAGGTEGGADRRLLKMVETIEVAAGLQLLAQRPWVIFAGNSQLREQVTAILGGTVKLQMAENVRPALNQEQLTDTMRLLGALYEDLRVAALPGVDGVLAWCDFPPLPTAQAFGGIVEYFAALYKGHVLGIDLGASSATFVSARPGQVRLAVRSDLGMGRTLAQVWAQQPPEWVLNWLPHEVAPSALEDFVRNKGLYPYTVPVTEEELYLEQALARAALQALAQGAATSWDWNIAEGLLPPFDLLVVRGGVLSETSRPAQVLAMLLDALQPTGVFAVALDRYGVLPALGALAPYEPLVPVQALEAGALLEMGWVVVPVGQVAAGETMLSVRMKSAAAGSLSIEVQAGTLEVLPLAPGVAAELTLEPHKRVDVGAGPGRARTVTVHGGAVGLVIDARGRPLVLPEEPENRRDVVRQWLQDMGG